MPCGVAGVADEAEHLAGLDVHPVARDRRERREVRVVELVPLRVAQPEPVAADVVPADREDEPVGDRRGSARRAARRCRRRGASSRRRRRGRRRSVSPYDDRAVDREDVAACGQPRLQAGRASPAAAASCGRSWSARGATGVCFRFACSGCFATGPGAIGFGAGADARLHVRLRVADPDLRAGRQRAVRRGQVDGERGHEAVEALRAAGAGARVGALLERHEVAPVAELRRGRSARRRAAEPSTVSDEIVAPAKSPLAVRPRVEPCAAPLTVVGRDLAAEEAERLHLARRGGDPGRARVARGRGADRSGADDRAVGRVGEAGAEGGVVGRRRDRAGLRADLAGHDHADRHRARRGARGRAGAAGASRPGEQDDETSQRHENREPLPHRPRIMSRDRGA